ncbi:Amylo-alpha-1,6-glucosidase [Rhodovastum atsumiense]|uniref:Amylo-alpha-1,6-glucosidase n=1 Tax=Rhodovastum atsumiense TaxID=504468 RepID=A0A5M6J0Q4_9PROT|nr:amylo-alpha-1,6-glucosidase [Rhodovastum atsumiense]KAA5614152.1 amylo-alpha-1,6-glucosidase [Rhodovastum atsumiense]CAH2599006.1 Amylo-alpha-1,6-glucosidase [Rhodovastum atsumiense]
MNVSTAPGDLDPYFIPATASIQETRPRTLKHGDTFAVLDRNGNMPLGGGTEGLYHRDTRYLSLLELLVGGGRPMLLSSTLREDNATLTCDLTNPDLFEDGKLVLEHDQVHIRRSTFLWQATFHERIVVRSFANVPLSVPIELRFAADFADLFEVRGSTRTQRGRRHGPRIEADRIILAYTGLDGQDRSATLRFSPAPAQLESARARFRLELPAAGRAEITFEIGCDVDPATQTRPPTDAFFACLRESRRALRQAAGRAASVDSSNDIFNESVRRSISDLTMLVTDTPEGPYPYAGIPWFSAAFGRDAMITALLVLWMDPAIARGVLLHLAANQAQTVDPVADAEPGKILHEVRRGEMAELGEVPFRRYYGSVDSTPLFVMLAGAYLERTADVATMQRLWPHILAALDWLDTHADRDGDGFVEYFRQTESGLANQGWKDSHDSVFHADGGLAEGPIALVEVQGYAYAARLAASRIAAALGDTARAAALATQAATLRDRIEAAFWCEDLGTYALALDGEKRPCRVRSSNAGHLLLCGVPSPERAARVGRQLMDPSFFSGWGVRTVAVGEARYNPMSYHNGSVWPHDNALIGLGLTRYGQHEAAARILHGLFEACVHIDLRRLPELFCGFARRRGQGPTFYPVACAPQAWAAVAPLGLLQAALGIGFEPATHSVVFDRPVLPDFAEQVILRNLAVNSGRIDVVLRGRGASTGMQVLRREGQIRAVMVS